MDSLTALAFARELIDIELTLFAPGVKGFTVRFQRHRLIQWSERFVATGRTTSAVESTATSGAEGGLRELQRRICLQFARNHRLEQLR